MALLTIAEAVTKTGKSNSTIRRLVQEARRSSDPKKRELVQPTQEEIKELRRRGESYTNRIAEKLLDWALQGQAPEKGSGLSNNDDMMTRRWVDQMLERMEKRHEKELERLEQQFKDERTAAAERETRILEHADKDKERFAKASENMTQALATAKTLTQNLLIPFGQSPSDEDSANADVISGDARQKKGSEPIAKSPSSTSAAAKSATPTNFKSPATKQDAHSVDEHPKPPADQSPKENSTRKKHRSLSRFWLWLRRK